MENATKLMEEIKGGLKKSIASQKDEKEVMKAMLNDPEYKVGVYSKDGKTGEYCPYEDSRAMFGNIISSTTHMNAAEAETLAKNYEVTGKDAETMVGISKEFINTYLSTGRKLPLGGREDMNVSLEKKYVDEKITRIPNQNKTTTIPAHAKIKASGSCPRWLKNKKED